MSQAEEKAILKKIEKDDPELKSLKWRIYEDESIIVRICKKMKGNTNLKQLFLLGNISNASCSAIGQLLAETKTLEYLHLSQTKIGAKGLEKIAKGLQNNISLRWLMLTQTKYPQLNDSGIIELAYVLRDNSTLTRFELTSFNITNAGAKALAGMINSNKGIKILKLSANPFNNDGMKDIALALKNNSTLKRLYLDKMVRGETGSSDKGILYVTHIITDNNNALEHLSFSQCAVDEKSLEALVTMSFSPSCGVRSLQLADCKFTDVEAKVLGAALRKNCMLTSLDISANQITTNGIRSLCLDSNFRLKELNISGNKLDDGTCSELASVLLANCSLQKLLMADCPNITPKGLALLESAIEYNFSIRYVAALPTDEKNPSKGRDFAKEGNLYLERNTRKLRTMEELFSETRECLPFVTSYKCAIDIGGFEPYAAPSAIAKTISKELRKAKTAGDEKEAKLKGDSAINRIYLYSNKLSKFPEELILYAHSLISLDLSSNDLTSLPPSILASLTRLEYLNLKFNKLQGVAPDIAFLSRLKALHLDHNQIESLPKRMLTLKNLKQLTVTETPLERINPPLVAIYMQLGETYMSLANLGLFALPEELFICPSAPSLEALDLSNNELRSLPPDLEVLTSLTSLNLANNRLDSLPWQLGLLTNLRTLELSGNPLALIPEEILAKPVSQILAFLLAQRDGTTKVYRMKLMFVGEENVGKTSLFNVISADGQIESLDSRLYGPSVDKSRLKTTLSGGQDKKNLIASTPLLDHQADTVSTDGIEIHYLRFPKGTKDGMKDLVLGCWDFAGQELYYSTHAFFLSKRSVFLVVFNLAEDIEKSKKRVDYWLATIHSKTKKCAVVVVGTHRDHKRCTKEYTKDIFERLTNEYGQKYPGIKGYFAVSCKTKKGYKTLHETLMDIILGQSHMGEEVPTSFMVLEEQLTTARRMLSPPIIHMDTFKDIALKCGVAEKAINTALQFMHDLGIILNFSGNSYRSNMALENLIILDPTWISNVFRSIVTTKHNFVNNGVIDHSNLLHVWRPPLYPVELHSALLAILEKCEISYPLRRGMQEGRSLIATLLPDIKPAQQTLDKEGWKGTDTANTMLRLYKLEFLPQGLFSRFLVRTLGVAEPKLYWKNGFLVQHTSPAGSNFGLFEADAEENTITLQIRGNNPAHFMTIALASLTNLIESWFEVDYTIYTHCKCVTCNRSIDPTLIAIKECEKLVFKGEVTYPCSRAPNGQVELDTVVPDLTLADMTDHQIPLSEIEMGELIGEGGNALVYKGVWKGQVVAFKELKINVKKHMSKEKQEEVGIKVFNEFRAEVWIMTLLNHPNIVHMAGIVKKPIALVTEFIPHGSLYQFLQRDDAPQKLHWAMRIKILLDIAQGVAFMHSLHPQIIHRDLKTLNILMAADNADAEVVAKVADFGTCVAATTFVGRVVDNPLWLAPEIMAGYEYSEKADVYSFGMIMYEVLERKLPYDEFETKFMSKLEKQIEEGLRPTLPLVATPPPYAELVRECWDNDPNARPDFDTIVKKLKKMEPEVSKLPFGWTNPDIVLAAKVKSKKKKKDLSSPKTHSNQEGNVPTWSITRTTTFSNTEDKRIDIGDMFSRNKMLSTSGSATDERRRGWSMGKKKLDTNSKTDTNHSKTDTNSNRDTDSNEKEKTFSKQDKTSSKENKKTSSKSLSKKEKTASKKEKKKEKKEKKKDKKDRKALIHV